jgi:phosphoglycerate dehydrogenase-like enzyme
MGKMKVLLHYTPGPAWQRELALLDRHGLQVDWCDETDDARFYNLLPDTQVLWHLLRPLSADDIARAASLRLIQKIGVGVNTIDLEAAKARDIRVCNMPGTNSRAVAEMALLLMLACLRRLPLLDRATREGRGWKLDSDLQDSYGELAGKTVGLVGFGAVPQMLAPFLRSMDALVIYSDLKPDRKLPHAFRELPQLLREADIVSLHVPLTATTGNLIDRKHLAMMRPGAILINTARGGLVEQAALLDALKSGHLGAAGLDVFATEPVPADEALLQLDNVVVAPHLAWLTTGTLDRSLKVAVENCRRLQAGEPLLHRVV